MEIAYKLIFFKDALKDIDYWKKSGNKQNRQDIRSPGAKPQRPDSR